MKIFLAPDKFKGSLTSFEACATMEAGIRDVLPDAEVLSFPMADGGDGFSAVMGHYLECEAVECDTVNALGQPISATYQWQKAQKTAIIETAASSGLAMIPEASRDALRAGTYGTGLLIADAILRGAETIVLGLGGSATTDMGTGILDALGFKFFDEYGNILFGSGEMLSRVMVIERPEKLEKIQFILACDVTNPLFGPTGAAYVYGPQKGADDEMMKRLDEGLRRSNQLLGTYSGKDPSQIQGSGAAGGIGAGLSHFFNVEFISGFDLVLEASGLLNELADTDSLLTGEGKFDAQSLDGKVTGRLIKLANQHHLKCVVFCGSKEDVDLQEPCLIVSFTNEGRTDENLILVSQVLREEVKRVFGKMQHRERKSR